MRSHVLAVFARLERSAAWLLLLAGVVTFVGVLVGLIVVGSAKWATLLVAADLIVSGFGARTRSPVAELCHTRGVASRATVPEQGATDVMRIDYAQGDHLRVGRLLIARTARDPLAPFLDGGTTNLVRLDDGSVAQLANAAEMLARTLDREEWEADVIGHDHAKLNEALSVFDSRRQVEHFGAVVLARWPGVAVGWQGARVPMLYRWRSKLTVRHLRWVLAGRPHVGPMGTDNSTEDRTPRPSRDHASAFDGSVDAVFPTPFGDGVPLA